MECNNKLVLMIYKFSSFQLHSKIHIQHSPSECPASSFCLPHQALSIFISIIPPPLALPCKGTRTLFRTLLHFSPCFLKMFISLVQTTMHSGTCLSVSNVSAHVKVSLPDPGQELELWWLTHFDFKTELLL